MRLRPHHLVHDAISPTPPSSLSASLPTYAVPAKRVGCDTLSQTMEPRDGITLHGFSRKSTKRVNELPRSVGFHAPNVARRHLAHPSIKDALPTKRVGGGTRLVAQPIPQGLPEAIASIHTSEPPLYAHPQTTNIVAMYLYWLQLKTQTQPQTAQQKQQKLFHTLSSVNHSSPPPSRAHNQPALRHLVPTL